MTEVFAIVLNWNAFDRSSRCLDSLLGAQGVELDFVAVDNASEDGSADRLAARFGEDHLLRLRENTGYAGGMDAGVQHWLRRTQAPFALVATEDMSFDAHTVARLLAALRARPRAGVAGPVVYLRGREQRVFCAGGEFDRRSATARLHRKPLSPQVYAVDWVDGCCMLLRREAIAAAGSFDPRFFIYYEEADLCHRLRQHGWEVVVVPDAAAWQEKPAVPSAGYFYYMARNRFLFWRKNFGLGTARVGAWTVADTVRMSGWATLALVVPALWSRVPERWSWLKGHVRGVARGTLAHLRGHYGR